MRASLGQGLGVLGPGWMEMGWCGTQGSMIPEDCTPCANLCCWGTNPAHCWLLGMGQGHLQPHRSLLQGFGGGSSSRRCFGLCAGCWASLAMSRALSWGR